MSILLLAMIVRTRRKRSSDPPLSSLTAKKSKFEKAKSTPPLLTDDDIKDMVDESEKTGSRTGSGSGYTPTPVGADDQPYDPALAGTSPSSASVSTSASPDDNEIYDPESAFKVKFRKLFKKLKNYFKN
jgi:hypothetical protein